MPHPPPRSRLTARPPAQISRPSWSCGSTETASSARPALPLEPFFAASAPAGVALPRPRNRRRVCVHAQRAEASEPTCEPSGAGAERAWGGGLISFCLFRPQVPAGPGCAAPRAHLAALPGEPRRAAARRLHAPLHAAGRHVAQHGVRLVCVFVAWVSRPRPSILGFTVWGPGP